MNINFKQIKNNRTRVWNRKIKYIVLHDTGNKRKGANAEMHFQYFNNSYQGSSADFFVDDTQILQINDYNLYRSWHCGDGNGKYGITNNNSVGIEKCINFECDRLKMSQNTIKLVAHLMYELDLDISKVVRHYDASRKLCPQILSPKNWRAWEVFKMSVMVEHDKIKIDKELELLRKAGIINSPKYWKRKSQEVEHLDTLLKNMAKYIKK